MIHLMLTWIAEAEDRSVVRVAEDVLARPLFDRYFTLLPEIKKLKKIRDQAAAITKKAIIPLPKIAVLPPGEWDWTKPEEMSDEAIRAAQGKLKLSDVSYITAEPVPLSQVNVLGYDDKPPAGWPAGKPFPGVTPEDVLGLPPLARGEQETEAFYQQILEARRREQEQEQASEKKPTKKASRKKGTQKKK